MAQRDADGAGRSRPVNHRGLGPRGYKRSDERILEDLHERLTYDPLVDATDIEVRVTNGEVTLDGHVENRAARRRAEDIAETTLGVQYVQNNLRVPPREPQRTDRETKGASTAASDTTQSGKGPGNRVSRMPASTDETLSPSQAAPLGMTGMMAAGESVGTPGGEQGPQDNARPQTKTGA